MEKEKVLSIYRILSKIWRDDKPLLNYNNVFELLCSVILSAQCTDEQVNKASPVLFKKFPDPRALSKASISSIEACIKSVGFYKTKARNLKASSKIIVEKFLGQVPGSMEELLSLPGVGRKTANLVLSSCFGQPGIIVDTHVIRVCQRIGLAKKKDATLIEKQIASLVPIKDWTRFSHAINRHGKFSCKARKPACQIEKEKCPIEKFCPKIGLD